MMYGIIGSGSSVTATALTGSLDELNAIPTEPDEEFFFVIAHLNSDNTKVDQAITKWMTKTETWYTAVLPTRGAPDDTLVEKADETKKEKLPYEAVLAEVKESEGKLLVLWDDDDEKLTDVVRQALADGIEVLDLTDALSPIEFNEEEEEEEEEAEEEEEDPTEADDEDETPEPAKTPAAKKGGAAKKAAAAVPPPPAPRKRGRKTNAEREAIAAAEAAQEAPETEEAEETPAPAPTPRKTAAAKKAAAEPVDEITAEGLTTVNLLNGGIDYDQLSQAIANGIVSAVKQLVKG